MVAETLGHYRILDKLGAGGMGEVYRAHDTTLDRDVALKILPAEVASNPDRLSRFEREAKALATLNHPNIVTIHTVELVDGIHFLTMELVEGESLSLQLPTGGIGLGSFFDIAIPLADALAAAHDKDIVHRDLKPANIMISANGQVKVVDFGLAKLRQPQRSPEFSDLATEPMTQEGLLVGTLPYMSPEQLAGSNVDARSDIFSLGIILYEMATGQRPFRGDSSVAILSSIIKDSPPEIDRLREDLPHHLGRIVSHCLRKDPDDRFQTARDVRNELRDLQREGESASHSSTLTIPRDPKKRSPLRRRVGIASLILVITIAVWLAITRPPPVTTGTPDLQAPPKIVILPFENLGSSADDYFADGITEEITSRLSGIRGLSVISRTTAMRYKQNRPSVTQIGHDLDVQYVLEGTVRWASTEEGRSRVRITPQLISVAEDSHLWSESYDRVLDDIFAIQSDLAQQVLLALNVALSNPERTALKRQPTQNLDAYKIYLEGKHLLRQPHFTLESWNEALGRFEMAVALDPEFTRAWSELARAHSRLIFFKVDASEERLAKARHAMDQARASDAEAPEVHLASGYYHLWALRDAQGAEENFRSAAKLMPNSTEVLEGMGESARLQGRIADAISYFRQAADVSPLDASPVVELALSQWWARQYPEALATCDRAIVIAPASPWPYFTKTMNSWSWKGRDPHGRAALEATTAKHPWLPWLWYWQEIYEGRYREAIGRLADSPGDWLTLKICIRPKPLLESYALELLRETELARAASEQAVEMLEERLKESPDDPRLHSSLGIALALSGDKARAIRAGKRGVDLFPLSSDAIYAQTQMQDLAHIYGLVGEYDSACSQLNLLLSIPGWISTALLETDPRWAPLREHSCYRELITKYSD